MSLLSSFATCCAAQTQSGQAPRQPYLYRWSFETGGLTESELPEGIGGGELTICGGQSGQVPIFQNQGGVSEASPGVLNASRNIYGTDHGAQVNSYGSALRMKKSSGRFTITMWIKAALPVDKQSEACLLNISPADNERAAQSVRIAIHEDSFSFTVNSSLFYKASTAQAVVKPNEWVFLAFCYDGLSSNPYYSQDISNAIPDTSQIGAILAGNLHQPTRLLGRVPLNTGAPDYTISPGPVSFDGLLIAVGSSNSRFDRSFVGWIDDVRIYDGLLSLAEIDRVRLEAMGK